MTDQLSTISRDSILPLLERYAVLLYHRTSESNSVNEAREVFLTHKGRSIESVPPTLEALYQHAKRSVYQAGLILIQCLLLQPGLPSPDLVMSSDSESEYQEEQLSLTELSKWKVPDLKDWLEKRKLNKSGLKDTLVKRVYRAMSNGDSDCSEEESVPVISIDLVSHPWKPLDCADIPEISTKDVDSYFMYHKNPTTRESTNFERQMKKANRLCNEGFIRNIEYNPIIQGSEHNYFRSKCIPSMKQIVQIGDTGKTAKYYSLHISTIKVTGLIVSAFCNCKAGGAGLCAHVDAVKSLQYGRKNEAIAIRDYTRSHLKTCDDVRIESCGLLVNPTFLYLGANIDGLVVCSKCGTGIVEVKCPYGSDVNDKTWRNMLPIECGKDKIFFYTERDSKLYLDENHNYMYQVQGQLALYELDWAHFVVWTKKGIHAQSIYFSQTIWDEMLPKLKNFYVSGIVPELFTGRVRRGKSLY
ncbi:unnamed protein product [Mytilus coruscus]|uniref:SAP domain-containing protein n=1 Tax=Mytilus coruscus TaxID=42192 RepID=A0A6J8EHI8_MYTCO|nr:unnamed protein product [Mytilus coruscus]